MKYGIKAVKVNGLWQYSPPVEVRDTTAPYTKVREKLYVFDDVNSAVAALEKMEALEAAGVMTPEQSRARIAELRKELASLGVNLTRFAAAAGWSQTLIFRGGCRASIYALELLAREMRGLISRVEHAGRSRRSGRKRRKT